MDKNSLVVIVFLVDGKLDASNLLREVGTRLETSDDLAGSSESIVWRAGPPPASVVELATPAVLLEGEKDDEPLINFAHAGMDVVAALPVVEAHELGEACGVELVEARAEATANQWVKVVAFLNGFLGVVTEAEKLARRK